MSPFELKMNLDLMSSVEERRRFITSNALFFGAKHRYKYCEDDCLAILTTDGNFTFFNADMEEADPFIFKVIEYSNMRMVDDNILMLRRHLKKVHLPSGVEEVSSCMFEACEKLDEVTLPDTIESIRAFAFNGCTSLKSIRIPRQTDYIGCTAFRDCNSLKSVEFIGKSMLEVKTMEYYPFGIEDESIICAS